jgi:hypothetical protein
MLQALHGHVRAATHEGFSPSSRALFVEEELHPTGASRRLV